MAQKVSSLAIDINVTGAPQASAALSNVEQKGKGAAESLGAMGAKGAAAAVALGAITVASRKMLEAAEQYNRISNKLAVVTGTAREAAAVQAQLFRVAQETGAEFEALASTYARIALSAKDLGVTQAQMVQVTANVAKSLQVSGASAAEAAAGATQLAQALGSGKLQGDELKSILENAPVLARSIAAGLNVSVGELRKMGSEGKLLSSDVFAAILSQTNNIDAAFGKMGTSMERSSTRLANSFNAALASIDNKIGASRNLARLFDALSGAIDGTMGSGATTGASSGMTSAEARARLDSTRAGIAKTEAERARVRASLARAGSGGNRPRVGGSGAARSRPRIENPGPNPAPLGSGLLGAGSFEAAQSSRRSAASSMLGLGGTIDTSAVLESIAAQSSELAARVAELGQGIGTTFADSIANGITAAVQTGSIGAGFKELGRTLIGGLGAMIRDFGIQALAASSLMQSLKTSLIAFLPGGAIGASVAMIALGSAMVGLAGRGARASFGTTNTGVNRGAAQSSTIIERGTLSSSLYGGGMAMPAGVSGAVASGNPVMVNATIIGYNDPKAQRDIAELMKRSAARGAV